VFQFPEILAMSLKFRFPTRDEPAARTQAAELAWATSLEPVRVSREGDSVQIEVHHPLAILLSGAARLICCGFGRVSRYLCPEGKQYHEPRGTQGA
jgi:hypothetical protein